MATHPFEPIALENELRLVNRDPEVARSPSVPDRFVVKFTFEGVHLRELTEVLAPRLPRIGVDCVDRFGMSLSFSGVEPGREGEVYDELQAALAEVNASRAVARSRAAHDREASEAASAVSAAELEAVRDGFHAARSV